MIRTNLPRPHEQRKIEELLARLAQMKQNPKPQVLKQAPAA
jgi:hypothetical protein